MGSSHCHLEGRPRVGTRVCLLEACSLVRESRVLSRKPAASRSAAPVAPGVATPRTYRSALGYGTDFSGIPRLQLGCHLFLRRICDSTWTAGS